MRARATRPAVLATLTIALGAEARSSGSSASVRRTTASKLSSMWRLDVGVAGLGEAAAPGGAGVVDEQVEAAVVLGSTWARTRSGASALGEVDGDVGRLAGQRLGQLAQALLAAGDEDQLGAGLAREPPRGRLADPARGAGDQRHAHRRAYPSRRRV